MESLVLLLTKYGYFILFPISIIEGPIVTIIAGFLVSLGLMNVFIVYAVVMAGDVIGDSVFYVIGLGGGSFISRYFKKNTEKIEKVKKYFEIHQYKAIAMSKLFHGIGIMGLLAAGSLRVSYKRYITICFLTTTAQSLVLLTVGILFGHAYVQLNKYLNYFSTTTIIAGLIIAFIIIIKKLKLFSD
ncbi:MAG: VTT domain-containing protein [Candidatus Azambacteria bacterium]|nr:VTT domain-containing protein [Candidatus Azambacteria bacterium]